MFRYVRVYGRHVSLCGSVASWKNRYVSVCGSVASWKNRYVSRKREGSFLEESVCFAMFRCMGAMFRYVGA